MVDPQTFSAKQRRDQQAFANRRDHAAEPWPPSDALVGMTNTTGPRLPTQSFIKTNNPA
jgi:hypothetical protein